MSGKIKQDLMCDSIRVITLHVNRIEMDINEYKRECIFFCSRCSGEVSVGVVFMVLVFYSCSYRGYLQSASLSGGTTETFRLYLNVWRTGTRALRLHSDDCRVQTSWILKEPSENNC